MGPYIGLPVAIGLFQTEIKRVKNGQKEGPMTRRPSLYDPCDPCVNMLNTQMTPAQFSIIVLNAFPWVCKQRTWTLDLHPYQHDQSTM